jgi:hypothetical protein
MAEQILNAELDHRLLASAPRRCRGRSATATASRKTVLRPDGSKEAL